MISYLRKVNIKKETIQKIFLLALLIIGSILLFCNYNYNGLKITEQKWFDEWQYDSENLVTLKIMDARVNGIMNYSGMLWGNFVYTHQVGLQGIVLSIVDKLLGYPENIFNILYIIVSLFTVLAVMMFVYWAYREFGLLSSITAYVTMMLSQWCIVSARNLYWVPVTLWLPFLCVLFTIRYEETHAKVNHIKLWVVAFIAMAIRFGCGFEFTSCVMITAELPVIYYCLKNKCKFKEYLFRALVVGTAAICAFLFMFAINFWQQATYYGGINEAWESITKTISQRTGVFNVEVAEVFQQSLETNLLEVFKTYLSGSRYPLVLNYQMDMITIFFIVIVIIYNVIKKQHSIYGERERHITAWLVTAVFSFLSPFSWFILAKGHCVIHTHINYILWSIPCLAMIAAFIGATVEGIAVGLRNKSKQIDTKKLVKQMLIIFAIIICIISIILVVNLLNNEKMVSSVKEGGKTLWKDEVRQIISYKQKLYYIEDDAAKAVAPYFLHIYPVSSDNLLLDYQKQYGFANHDFSYDEKDIPLFFWNQEHACCVDIPDYSIKQIMTGQYTDSGSLWQVTIDMVN